MSLIENAVLEALKTPVGSLEYDDIIDTKIVREFILDGEIIKGTLGLVPEEGKLIVCVNVPWLVLSEIQTSGKNYLTISKEIAKLFK